MDLELYRTMVAIRTFELRVRDLSAQGFLRGSAHVAIGQEGAAAGVCGALTPEDAVTSTHRPHGHAIAKGLPFAPLFAELLGRATGVCHGKGGSMHLADTARGFLGANGIVGGGVPIAVGAALGFQQLGQPHVAVAFFGDGATNQGAFHESLNLASVWRLPVLFVCENNRMGLSTPIEAASAEPDLVKRAVAYRIPGRHIDGTDVRAVYQAAHTGVDAARRGEGPSLLVLDVYRHEGHFTGDPMGFRSQAEEAAWRDRDPIARQRTYLLANGLATEADLEQIQATLARQVDAAVATALAAPEPDPTQLLTDIYAAGEGVR